MVSPRERISSGRNASCRPTHAKAQTRALVDDSFADGVQNEFGSAVETQLFKNVAAVRLYGVRTDEESGRDLFVGFSFSQQLKNLPLARAEELIGVHRALLPQHADIVFGS